MEAVEAGWDVVIGNRRHRESVVARLGFLRERRLRGSLLHRLRGLGGLVEPPPLDRRDHRAVLLLHQPADPLVVDPDLHLFGVGRLLRRQDLSTDIHQRLDVGIGYTFVLGLYVVDLVVVPDVGVEPGNHRQTPRGQ